jgi:hypothetical protein
VFDWVLPNHLMELQLQWRNHDLVDRVVDLIQQLMQEVAQAVALIE